MGRNAEFSLIFNTTFSLGSFKGTLSKGEMDISLSTAAYFCSKVAVFGIPGEVRLLGSDWRMTPNADGSPGETPVVFFLSRHSPLVGWEADLSKISWTDRLSRDILRGARVSGPVLAEN